MLGQILLSRGLICSAELEAALDWQRTLAGEWPVRRLGSLLIKAGVLTGSQVADALAAQRGQPVASCLPRHVDPSLRGIFPLRTLILLQAVPLHLHGETLVVAMVDPHNREHVDALRAATEYQVQAVQAPQLQVYRLLRMLAEEPRWTPTQPLQPTVDLVPPRRLAQRLPALDLGPPLRPEQAPASEARVQLGTWLVALAVAMVALASIGLGLRLQDRNLGRDTVSWLLK